MKRLMRALGNPEARFKSVHVAGTNGKGSVCAMLESVLRRSGIRTGLYTSPHLLDVRERIRVSGGMIGREALARWLGEVRGRAGPLESGLTYFEAVTAAAFCHFAAAGVELAVVETGMGGRLDATNVLPRPEAAVITAIAADHTEHLGKSPARIAREKAGILKPGTACVTQARGPALAAVRSAARRLGVRVTAVRPERTPGLAEAVRACALKGDFQRGNIAAALLAAEELRKKGWRVPRSAVRDGLKSVRWPGRFDERTLRAGGTSAPVLLDVAHNPAAIAAILSSVKKRARADRPCLLFFNVLKDKNAAAMVRLLKRGLKIARAFVPSLPTERSSDALAVAGRFQEGKMKVPATAGDSVGELWRLLKGSLKGSRACWVLATGSFYIAGGVLAELDA